MSEFNLSFEFFPPKTVEGSANLLETARALKISEPEFFSVTFGAGGTMRQGTIETVLSLQAKLDLTLAPHISCIGLTQAEVQELLDLYMQNSIDRLVVLRGDLPSGMGSLSAADFSYASELVEFIREETGDHFHIDVACYPEMHPQASDPYSDLENFHAKIASGADRAITQYFFNPDAYFRFVDECAAMDLKLDIIPGIMPLTNCEQILRFSKICGAEIPRWIRLRLERLQDDPESLQLFGLEVVTNLCETLIDNGIPGLHFYTLNKAEPTLSICRNLKFIP